MKPISDVFLPSLAFRNNLSPGTDFTVIKSASLILMVFKNQDLKFSVGHDWVFHVYQHLHPA